MDKGQDDFLDITSSLFYSKNGACGVGMIDAELICCTEGGGHLWPPLFCLDWIITPTIDLYMHGFENE